jgi:hypothetical protein
LDFFQTCLSRFFICALCTPKSWCKYPETCCSSLVGEGARAALLVYGSVVVHRKAVALGHIGTNRVLYRQKEKTGCRPPPRQNKPYKSESQTSNKQLGVTWSHEIQACKCHGRQSSYPGMSIFRNVFFFNYKMLGMVETISGWKGRSSRNVLGSKPSWSPGKGFEWFSQSKII